MQNIPHYAFKRFFKDPSIIRYNPKGPSQIINNEGVILLGDRPQGAEQEINYLYHEMAHLVEIDDQRMRMFGWGLKLPKVWVIDRYCIEPMTCQITEREIRVLAYQANLQDYLKDPMDDSWIDSCRYLPDFHMVPIADGSSAYGDDRNHNLSYDEIQNSQIEWVRNQIKEKRKVFTLDRFFSEWDRKMEWLKNNPYQQEGFND